MIIDLRFKFEDCIDNIILINDETVRGLVFEYGVEYETKPISCINDIWNEYYQHIIDTYKCYTNYFSKYTKLDLVRKSGFDICENNLDSILKMSEHINKDNILNMVYSGSYNPHDKYALYHQTFGGFFTTNDINEYIYYKKILKTLDENEYKILNEQYEELHHAVHVSFVENEYSKIPMKKS